ncbi:MAG: hypothetical protein ABIN48_05025 [Ginsengibacter sp.]
MKTQIKMAKIKYSFIIDGKVFNKEELFEGRNDSNFFNDIEEELNEKYGDRLDKVDHSSRIIHLKY